MEYLSSLEDVMEYSLIRLGDYIKLGVDVGVQSTHSTAEMSFRKI